MGIEPIILRRNTPHGSCPGKVRWGCRTTISCIKGPRRLRIRYDRHPTIIDAWNHLALAAVCFRILNQTTWIIAINGGSLSASEADIRRLAGKTLRLRFVIKDADLFAMKCGASQ